MATDQPGTIGTPNLRLVPLTARFVEAELAGDTATAQSEVGARVGPWLATDPSHLAQLHLAATSAEAAGFPGLGRAIVLEAPGRAPRVIGTIGFHGPPDERGRLEASCRIHPALRGRGYAAEALAALLDWAETRFGVTRFLVAVPARRERLAAQPIEIAVPIEAQVHQLARLLEPADRIR